MFRRSTPTARPLDSARPGVGATPSQSVWRSIAILLAIAIVIALASVPATPAGEDAHDVTAPLAQPEVRDALEFAEALARHRYFDLAAKSLDAPLRTANSTDRVAILRALASIARSDALAATDPAAAARAFEASVARWREVIAAAEALPRTNPSTAVLATGEDLVEGLAATLIDVGRFWFAESQRLESLGPDQSNGSNESIGPNGSNGTGNSNPGAGSTTPSDAPNAAARASAAFDEAIRVFYDARRQLDVAAESSRESDADTRARIVALAQFATYRRGEACLEFARTFPLAGAKDKSRIVREGWLLRAIDALNDYIWEAAGDSVLTFSATEYLGAAEYELARDRRLEPADFVPRHEKALALLSHVGDGPDGLPPAELATADLPAEERAAWIEVVERATRTRAQIRLDAASRLAELQAGNGRGANLDAIARAYRAFGSGSGQVRAPIALDALVTALRRDAIADVDALVARASKLGWSLGDAGREARLERARAFFELGDAATAVASATEIASLDTADEIGARATELLESMLAVEGDGGVAAASITAARAAATPAAWNLVATRARRHDRPRDAIDAWHFAIDRARSDDEVRRFAIPAWRAVGDVHLAVGEPLEAAIAFEEGLALAATARADEATDALAVAACNAWTERFNATKDPFDQQRRDALRKVVSERDASPDVTYFLAKDLFAAAQGEADPALRQAAFTRAAAELAAVKETSLYHERSIVYLARCFAELGERDKALATFDRLFARVESVPLPAEGSGPRDPIARHRAIALAEATCHRAGLLLDASRFADVLASLADYERRFPEAIPFHPIVAGYRVAAILGSLRNAGDLTDPIFRLRDAEQAVAEMSARYPDHAATLAALEQLATAYAAHADRARDEHRPDVLESSLTRARDALARANDARGRDAPLPHLQLVASWSVELTELGDGDRRTALRRAIDDYRRLAEFEGGGPDRVVDAPSEVLRTLGTLLIEEPIHDFEVAEPIWRELHERDPADHASTLEWAHCLGGEAKPPTRDLNAPTECRGAGRHAEAIDALLGLRAMIEAAGDKRSPDWWEVNVQLVHQLACAGESDAQVAARGRQILSYLKSLDPTLGGDSFARRLTVLDRRIPS